MSRGEYGALGPDENCWPQMACSVPSANDEVFMNDTDIMKVIVIFFVNVCVVMHMSRCSVVCYCR